MKTPRLPIALQQAVMRSLRQSLERANQVLKTAYPEPKLLYQQRGSSLVASHPTAKSGSG